VKTPGKAHIKFFGWSDIPATHIPQFNMLDPISIISRFL